MKKIEIVLFLFLSNLSLLHATKHVVTSTSDDKNAPQIGMLRYYINNAAQGDTIVFEIDSLQLQAEIKLYYKSLTIDGGKGVIIDGGGNGRIFNITFNEQSRVVVKKLIIQNGLTDDASLAWGGGVYAFGSGEGLMVENCTFKNNSVNSSSDGQGAGLRTQGGTYKNCFFLNNKLTGTGYSNSGGGVMSIGGTFTNCVFAGNSSKYGGGVYATSGSEFTNCTVTQNSANSAGNGAGIGCEGSSVFTNCIVYNNQSSGVQDNVCNNGGSFSYSAFESGNSLVGNNHNIALTVTPFTHSGADSFALTSNSECNDKGTVNNITITKYDIAGNPRISGSSIDIGAYEYISPLMVTRSDDSWTLPIKGMLRYAIQNATNGETITFAVDSVVAGATFNFGSKSIIISGKSVDNVAIIGNYGFTLFDINISNNTSPLIKIENLTFKKGGGNVGGLYLHGYLNDNVIIQNCSFIANKGGISGGAKLNGGVISNCLFRDNECTAFEFYISGGLFAEKTKITDCKFENNRNNGRGDSGAGGLYTNSCLVSGCNLSKNTSKGGGAVGGARADISSVYTNCIFYQNYTSPKIVTPGGEASAGGVKCTGSSTFINCRFIENIGSKFQTGYSTYPPEASGGLFVNEGNIINCLFDGNEAEYAGGIYSSSSNEVKIINCTFINNIAYSAGNHYTHGSSGGLYILGDNVNYAAKKAIVRNCILYGNHPNDLCNESSKAIISNCAIQETLFAGTSNFHLATSPFESLLTEDSPFLKNESICINAGDTVGVSKLLPSIDIFGNSRINGNIIDIGAVEFKERIAPSIIWPTISEITYGVSLAMAIHDDGYANIQGYFVFDGSAVLNAGQNKVNILFAPIADSIGNYKSITDSLSIIIAKAKLSVTPQNAIIKYGDVEPNFELLYNGFVRGEDLGVIDKKPVASVTDFHLLNAGTFPEAIVPSGGEDNNYDFSYQAGDLVINKTQLLATANDTTAKYGDGEPTYRVVYTGFVKGENKSIIDNEPIASVNNYAVLVVGEYADAIVVSGGEDNNYDLTYQTGNLVISKAQLLAAAQDTTVKYGDVEPVYRVVYSGFVKGENISVIDKKPIASVSNYSGLGVGEYSNAIVVSGAEDNNYEFTYKAGKLKIDAVNSANNEMLANDFLVYPNPMTNNLIIVTDKVGVLYELYSFTGIIIKKGVIINNKQSIDVSAQPTGMFVLLLKSKDGILKYKILKN